MKNEMKGFEDFFGGLVSGYEGCESTKTKHGISQVGSKSREIVVTHYVETCEAGETEWVEHNIISDPLDIEVTISNSILSNPVINPILSFEEMFLPTQFLEESNKGIDDVIEVLLREEEIEFLKLYELKQSTGMSVAFSGMTEPQFGSYTLIACKIFETKYADQVRERIQVILKNDGAKEIFKVA